MEEMGGIIYGPYTGRWFESTKETDIEHIVARLRRTIVAFVPWTPRHVSGLLSDLLNLTLASPTVNRQQKRAYDVAEWLPDLNQCWYVDRVVQVRLKYSLTVDQREADALDEVMAGCASVEMVITAEPMPTLTLTPTPTPASEVDALALWDDNGNGRITCAEARRHGIAPVRRGHPAYEYMDDRDGDGIVCE